MDAGTRMMAETALIGNHVKNTQGEDCGRIQELVIDAQTGKVVGAVLCSELLDQQNRVSAIPWNAMTVSPTDGSICIDPDATLHPYRRERDWDENKPYSVTSVTVYTSSIFTPVQEHQERDILQVEPVPDDTIYP